LTGESITLTERLGIVGSGTIALGLAAVAAPLGPVVLCARSAESTDSASLVDRRITKKLVSRAAYSCPSVNSVVATPGKRSLMATRMSDASERTPRRPSRSKPVVRKNTVRRSSSKLTVKPSGPLRDPPM